MSQLATATPATTGPRRGAIFEPEHDAFRESFRQLLERRVVPSYEEWRRTTAIPADLFSAIAEQGSLGLEIPEELGGAGVEDFRFNAVILEETMRIGASGLALALAVHNELCVPLLLRLAAEPDRWRWLRGAASGAVVTAFAASDPATVTSEVAVDAVRADHGWLLSGTCRQVINGLNAELLIVPARCGPDPEAFALFAIERASSGIEVAASDPMVGMRNSGAADLTLRAVPVPASSRLSLQTDGATALAEALPRLQLALAVAALAGARAALAETLAYVHDRRAFGEPIASFQNTRMALAEVASQIEVAEPHLDAAILAVGDDALSPERAATAKLRCTRILREAVDSGLQLHGGYGYILEYPIAQAYADAPFLTLYAGKPERLRETIAASIGL